MQGKELRNARKLRKVVAIYKTNKLHAFYKQFFYKQRQTKIGKKIKQKLSKTLRLDFFYLKISHFLHLCYHPKLTWDVLRNVLKTSVSDLMRLCN